MLTKLLLSSYFAAKLFALKFFGGKLALAAIPPSAPANSYIIEGLSTIQWGTDGFLQDAGLTTAIVNSIKPAYEVEKFQIENNAGFRVVRILLIQGVHVDLTVTDDSARSWPAPGSKMTIMTKDNPTALVFLCTDSDYNASKKKEGERHFMLEFSNAYAVT